MLDKVAIETEKVKLKSKRSLSLHSMVLLLDVLLLKEQYIVIIKFVYAAEMISFGRERFHLLSA